MWNETMDWNEQWTGMMEWKMEWNSEHTHLQLNSCITVHSRLNYTPGVSLGLLSHRRSFMSQYGVAHMLLYPSNVL